MHLSFLNKRTFMPYRLFGIQYQLTEWLYLSGKSYNDPLKDIELDVILTHFDGQSWRVTEYWAGDNEWCMGFSLHPNQAL